MTSRFLNSSYCRGNTKFIAPCRYGGGSFSFSRVILTLTRTFSSEYELAEVEDFFARHQAGSGALAVEQAKEVIKGNIEWMHSNLETVRDWLDRH